MPSNTNPDAGSTIYVKGHRRWNRMETFDRLPKAVRKALANAEHDYHPMEVYKRLKMGPRDTRWSQERLIDQIQKADEMHAYEWAPELKKGQ